ncbi:hypothetical protein N0V83_000940 [Neocucurbitaria cava]|uniref:Asteroid domain-containing protein n=1 Tax=Neocucurbitaria cava TaxID=798079 RepID=A0A9W8YIG0_9PLEO|nr:hypothetical protein N0V83_000940 [Neocucurbitaria cava]
MYQTLIVFLNDADLWTDIRAYSPERIRHKLELKSLLAYAFSISQGPSDTAAELLSKAQRTDSESEHYVAFSRRYTAEVVAPSYLLKITDRLLMLQNLDVRVSEFVHQTLDGSMSLLVYLPLLVEDSNQASAWNIGQNIRILAYSLLAPQNTSIHEYKRKAQGISMQEINTCESTNVRVPAVDLHQQVSALTEWASLKAIGPDLLWPLFALSLVLADLNTPPPVLLALRVLNGDFDNTWAFIQLTARVQAVLYSLRMLKQIIGMWLEVTQTKDAKLSGCLSGLYERMKNFPSIARTFTVPGQKAQILAEHEELRTLVEDIYTSCGVEVPVEQVSNKTKKRQAREAERKKRKAEQRQQPKLEASKVFTSLSTESGL